MNARVFASSLAALSLLLTFVAIVFFVLGFNTPTPTFGFRGTVLPLPVIYSVLGLLITQREQANLVGWLFLANGLLAALLVVSDMYAIYGLITRPGLPGVEWIVLLQEWGWVPMFGITVCVIPLYFPNGQLLSRRWLPVLGFAVIATAAATVALMIKPGPLEGYPMATNPIGISVPPESLETVMGIGVIALAGAGVAAAFSLWRRFRRAEQEQRQQIKWVLASGFFAVCSIAFGGTEEPALQTVTILGLLAVPAATGLSVLKYRLYDIDIVIRRSLVYVPLTAILAGVYMAGVGVFKALFDALTGGLSSEASVAFTTLLVVALLTPIKNSLQTVVDARFKEPPDPATSLARFDAQVRQVLEVLTPDELARRFLQEVAKALQAEAGGVYIFRESTKELAATHGSWNGQEGSRFPLMVEQMEVGELWLVLPDGRPLRQRDRSALEHCTEAIARAIVLAPGQQTPVTGARRSD